MELITGPAALTAELRRAVLRPHLAPGDPLPAEDTPGVVHVAALEEGTGAVLGACMVFPEPCDWLDAAPAWRLRAMAVDPRARGLGVGARVVAHARAQCAGGAVLWCHARESAAGFWHRVGFRDREPLRIYLDAEMNLPHRDMWTPLP